MVWFGRWVSNYRDGDEVLALLNTGEFIISNIYFISGREDFYLGLSGLPVCCKRDVFSISPSDDWYIKNTDVIFDDVTKPQKTKRSRR